jgi:hypothetical protein
MCAILGATVQVSYDASAQSAALNSNAGEGGLTKYRIVASTACHILASADPTATTSHTYLPANVVDYILVPSGHKIAAIKASGGSAGILSINRVE